MAVATVWKRLCKFLAVILCGLTVPVTGWAACTLPAGTAGQIIYNADYAMPQYCDGTNWIGFGGTSTGAGPVGYWKLDESSGATADDAVGTNDGTMTGGPLWAPTGGKIGGAVGPLTSNEYIDFASRNFGNAFTVTLWMKAETGLTGVAHLWANKISWDPGDGMRLYVDYDATNIVFNTGDPTNSLSNDASTATGSFIPGQWQHVAVAVNRTAGTATIYVDGVDRTSDSSIRTDFKVSEVWRLASTTNISDTFRGYLDELRVYDRILSAAEIARLYDTGMGATAGSPGTVQPDGSVYAGQTPDGSARMYVPRCDAGQTWDGSSCTGTRSSLSWNAASIAYVNTSLTDCTSAASCGASGRSDTATLVATDSETLPGFQDHNAAKYCSDLTMSGRSDWYLPSAPELLLMYDNLTAIGNFDTTGPYYWSSSEMDLSTAWLKNFMNGSEVAQFKDVGYFVRCARQGTECTGPLGAAGTIVFNNDTGVLQYCNGSSWVGVDAGAASTGTYSATGLVARWKLDEGSGTTAQDSSGNGHTGTLTNGPTWTTGQIGGAVQFDGTNDYIAVSGDRIGTGTVTVCAWIYPTVFNNNQQTILGNGAFLFRLYPNSTGAFQLDSDNPTATGVVSPDVLKTNMWQHVCGVRYSGSGGRAILYLNGVDVASGNSITPAAGTTETRIGGYASFDPWPFTGRIDDVRIYSRDLSASEIEQLYRTTVPPVMHLKLDEGSGTVADDAAGSNDGTLANGPVWQPAGGRVGGALDFDGTNDKVTVSSLDLTGTNAVSVAFWLKKTDWSADLGTIFRGGTNSASPYDLFYMQQEDTTYCGAGHMTVGFQGNTGPNQKCYSRPADGEWHHYVAVFDKNQGAQDEVHLYLDGSLQTTVANPSASNNAANDFKATPFYLMTYTGSANYASGRMDDVRVWKRALSAAEAADLYNATAPAMPTPSAHWKFDEGSGITAADEIGNNDGTLINGTTWSTGMFGGAVSFDGVDDEVNMADLGSGNTRSFAFWFKTTDGPAATLFSWPAYQSCMIWYSDNLICSGDSTSSIDGYSLINDDQWHHAVYTVSQSPLRQELYIDGILEAFSTTNAYDTTPTGLTLGNYNWGGHNYAGLLDDFRVYDTVLTAAQVRALYRATACSGPPGAPGTMIYNTSQSRMQYCNGTNWVGIGK